MLAETLGVTVETLPLHPRTNAKPCDHCGHRKGIHGQPCRIGVYDKQGRHTCGCPTYEYTPRVGAKARFVTPWKEL